MKKYFENAEIKITRISTEDIITGSGGGFLGGFDSIGGDDDDDGSFDTPIIGH